MLYTSKANHANLCKLGYRANNANLNYANHASNVN